jgi:hypothetical protein
VCYLRAYITSKSGILSPEETTMNKEQNFISLTEFEPGWQPVASTIIPATERVVRFCNADAEPVPDDELLARTPSLPSHKPTPKHIEEARVLWMDILYKDGQDAIEAIAQFLADRDGE